MIHQFHYGFNKILNIKIQKAKTFLKQNEAMGNPISPILVDKVMQDLEQEALAKLGFSVPFYFILICLPKQHIDHTKNIFNSYSDHLQFTIEKII